MRKVACISLPHASESVLLKGFPVAHVQVARRLQVIAAYETLDGTYTDGCGNVAVPDELEIDLRGVEPGKILPELVDTGDSLVGKDAGGPLVRACFGHQRVDPAAVVERNPFFEGLVVVDNDFPVRLGERLLCDPLVVLCPAPVRVKILDDRCDEGKAELRDLCRPGDLTV